MIVAIFINFGKGYEPISALSNNYIFIHIHIAISIVKYNIVNLYSNLPYYSSI